MALIRWNPGMPRDLLSFQEEVNRMLDSSTSRDNHRTDRFMPPAEIEESAEEYRIRLDLPGVSQQDVKVSLMGDTLTIRGERKQNQDRKDGNVHHSERVYGAFERRFKLGTPVRNDQVQATYKDGVLEIRIPKAEEARVREIQVQVG